MVADAVDGFRVVRDLQRISFTFSARLLCGRKYTLPSAPVWSVCHSTIELQSRVATSRDTSNNTLYRHELRVETLSIKLTIDGYLRYICEQI